MDRKTAFKAANRRLPSAWAQILHSAVVPDWADVTTPLTVDDAVIEQGRLAAMLNHIFSTWEGVPLLEIPLRVSQYHPGIEAIASAFFEADPGVINFEIVTPQTDDTYPPGDVSFELTLHDELQEGDDVSMIVLASDGTSSVQVDLVQDGNSWAGTGTLDPGAWVARFVLLINDLIATQSVGFDVIEGA